MSDDAAAVALGAPLERPAGSTEECRMVPIPGLPSGTLAMLVRDTLVRIDVLLGSEVETDEGVRIGDHGDEVRLAYPGAVRILPHKYTDGSYLVVVPLADTIHRLVFETDAAGRVTRFRSGRFPEVEWVEGCG